jgi:hypothetical protein
MVLWDLFRKQYVKGKVIYKSRIDNGRTVLDFENQIDRIQKNLIEEICGRSARSGVGPSHLILIKTLCPYIAVKNRLR